MRSPFPSSGNHRRAARAVARPSGRWCSFGTPSGGRGDRQAVKRAGLARKKDFSVLERASRVGGEGTAVVAPSLQDALALAKTLAAPSGRSTAPSLRVICDFGPVLGGDMKPDEKMVARLKAGSDMPGFPLGRVLATQSFAAEAMAELGDAIEVYAVGRTEEGRDSEGGKAKRRPSVPVYRVALKGAQ